MLSAGCSTSPLKPVPPLPALVPAAWASAPAPGTGAAAVESAVRAAEWWPLWGDPLLVRLAAQAAQANSRLLTAQATLRQAQALRDAAAAGLSPTLALAASAQRSDPAQGSASNSFGADLNAAYEPFASRSGVRASAAALRARNAALGDVQVAIATELGLAYIDLRSTQARLAIAQGSAASQQQSLQIVDWRLQAGLVTALEKDQARSALAQTRAQLPLLQKRIEQTAHALAVLTGQVPAALRAELVDAPATGLPQPSAELALSLPADTLRQRADVQAAAWDLEAAWQRVAQADAARRPSLRISGNLGLNALTLGTLASSGALAASVLASLAWPVWDGGAATAQVAVQQAAWDSARVSYQATVLAALQDVEDALVALRDDRLRLLQLQQAAQAAAQAAALATQRFNSGLVDYAAVLETQRSALSTQDSVASAQAEVSADHMRLFQALGGGWRPDSVAIETAPPTDTRKEPR